MTRKSSLVQFIATLLTIVVAGLPLSTEAQERCGSIFKTSIYDHSFVPLRDLVEGGDHLAQMLKNNPHRLTVKELQQGLRYLEGKAAAYFRGAGILYSEKSVSLPISGLAGEATAVSVKYTVYELTGSKLGDENSRMIFAAQVDPASHQKPLFVEFDLLYKLTRNDLGVFHSDLNTISIGPHVFGLDATGVASVLRHEIQHAFEQKKMARGEMTLARIGLYNNENQTPGFYSKYLRMDEAESHLRDLRAFLHPNMVSKKERISKVFPPGEKQVELQKTVMDKTLRKIDGLEEVIARSMIMNNQMEKLLYEDKPDYKVFQTSRGVLVEFKLPPVDPPSLSPYTMAQVSLEGLFASGSQVSERDVQKALFKVLDWNRIRMQQIEREVVVLRAQLNQRQGL